MRGWFEDKCFFCKNITHLHLKTRYSHQTEFRWIPICINCYKSSGTDKYDIYGSEEK